MLRACQTTVAMPPFSFFLANERADLFPGFVSVEANPAPAETFSVPERRGAFRLMVIRQDAIFLVLWPGAGRREAAASCFPIPNYTFWRQAPCLSGPSPSLLRDAS